MTTFRRPLALFAGVAAVAAAAFAVAGSDPVTTRQDFRPPPPHSPVAP